MTNACALCWAAGKAWQAAHRAEIEAAAAAALKAAGLPPGHPQAAQLDFRPFLPEALRDSVPVVREMVTVVQGNGVCDVHFPQAPGLPGAAPRLLAAQGPLTRSALAGLG